MKSSANHIDPEKSEQLKSAKIDVENKVKMIIKLVKGNGNKNGNMKNKSEIIHLIEDFQQHYESLYSSYEDLRGEVSSNVNGEANDSSSDSESYYSPVESTPKRGRENGTEISKGNKNSETSSDVEDTILKDKLTSSSEIKETPSLEFDADSDKMYQNKTADLGGEVARLKVTVDCKSDEVTLMREENSRLEARVLELESTCKDKEILLSEVKALSDEKGKLEELLSNEINERSVQVRGWKDQLDSLQQEMKSMSSQKSELELELKKKTTEISNCLVQIENHKANRANLIQKDAIEENGLEIQANNFEALSKVEEQKMMELQRKISQLQTSLSDKEKEIAAAKKKHKASQNEFSNKIVSLNEKIRTLENNLESLQNERSGLQTELEALRNENREFSVSKSKLERKNAELTEKIADQQKTLLELGDSIAKLKAENEKPQIKFSDSKPNFHLLERKIEEMAEEFRKQFEDKYRILSRRIRVAEQLQIENREWYQRTKEAKEEECIRNIKEISPVANDILLSLDLIILKFEDCNANFSNRISKAFCELKFAKDWVTRKNNALVHMKHDLDELLCQLDDKEAEILVFREKIWKSENKSRELEKMMKKTEDAMLGLQEEKREAIRQLCVWIDYHRSRSDYYMKMLSEMNAGRRKGS